MTIRLTTPLDPTPTFDIRPTPPLDYDVLARVAILNEKERGYAARRSLEVMSSRYDCDLKTAMGLGEAAGTLSDALQLLDDGMPTDYILAMGEAR